MRNVCEEVQKELDNVRDCIQNVSNITVPDIQL